MSRLTSPRLRPSASTVSASRRLETLHRTLKPGCRSVSTHEYSVFGPNKPVAPSRVDWPEPPYPQERWEPKRPQPSSDLVKFDSCGNNKVDEWRDDPNVHLVVGQGEGKAFASGGDIKSVVDAIRHGRSVDGITMFADSFRLCWKFARLGKPYVSVIDGYTMGGGAGIALPADIRIATRRTVYASPETKFGYSPDFGGSYFIRQLDGQIGTWLAVTGQNVYGRAAFELGIASHYVAEESVPEIVHRLTQLETPSREEISALVSEYHAPPGEGVTSKSNPDGSSSIQGRIRSFLDETFALPSLAAVYTRLSTAESDSRLQPEVQAWAREQREMMDTRGPTGMAVALYNYHIAATARRYATSLEHDILMGTGFGGAYRVTNDLVIGGVHQLFDKKPPPTPFRPSMLGLETEDLTPKTIERRFFRRGSPHLRDAPPMDVDGGLFPPPDTAADPQWGHFRAFGVPSEAAIRMAIGGGATETVVMKSLLGHETGIRRAEFEEAIRRVIERKVVRGVNGRLEWSE